MSSASRPTVSEATAATDPRLCSIGLGDLLEPRESAS
jgi:hypothetical protein